MTWESDGRFHAVFVDACGNPDLQRVLAALRPRLQRLELLHAGPLPGRRALAQHEAILTRAASGDVERSASATREHWLSLGALVERALVSSN